MILRKILGPSWRTSLGGISAVLMVFGTMVGQMAGTVDHQGQQIPDSEVVVPETESEAVGRINWPMAVAALGGLGLAFGLFGARDNKVNSRVAGAE